MDNLGTGKTHPATSLGPTAFQQGKNVRFFAAARLINQLNEAHAGFRLSHVQKVRAKLDLLSSKRSNTSPSRGKGAGMFFQVVADSYGRQLTFMATHLGFCNWPQVFHSEQLARALMDRLSHHAHILAINRKRFQFKQSVARKKKQ